MDNVSIIRPLYDSFARGDVTALLERLDPAVEWFEAEGYPAVGGCHVGHSGVLEALSRVAADWEQLTMIPDRFVAEGNCVIVLGLVSGSYRASRKSFRSRFAHEWILREGLITLWRAHLDTALVREATIG